MADSTAGYHFGTCADRVDGAIAAPEGCANDVSLLDGLREGSEAAYEQLIALYQQPVYNLVFRLLNDPSETADVMQEVFIKVFRAVGSFRAHSSLKTWIYRIAVNTCVSRARRRPQGIHISLDSDDSESGPAINLKATETQDHELLRAENQRRVRTALSFLSPDQRAVVELKFFQEMTFEDIAAVLQVPLSTIKSRLYSGLEMLKVRLGAKV